MGARALYFNAVNDVAMVCDLLLACAFPRDIEKVWEGLWAGQAGHSFCTSPVTDLLSWWEVRVSGGPAHYFLFQS